MTCPWRIANEPARALPVKAFLEFATVASGLVRAPKAVRFGGRHWKL